MLRGIDTTFLVQAEVVGHPEHGAARQALEGFLAAEDELVLAPQVVSEFVQVVTDPRRFSRPLTVRQAVARAQVWWNAREVGHALPTVESVRLMLDWVHEYRLGRKRLLDTQLAATYFCHGVRSVVSSNARDYRVFGCFEVVVPGSTPAG